MRKAIGALLVAVVAVALFGAAALAAGYGTPRTADEMVAACAEHMASMEAMHSMMGPGGMPAPGMMGGPGMMASPWPAPGGMGPGHELHHPSTSPAADDR
jgi:hypothetical protein